MIIIKNKKSLARLILAASLLFVLIVNAYANIEFGEGYQSCKIAGNQTWYDLEAEYKIPAEIIALFNKKTVSEPLKEGMRIKIPDKYTETIVVTSPNTNNQKPVPDVTVSQSNNPTVPIPIDPSKVAGYVSTVTVDGAEIRTHPMGQGDLLYNKTQRGMTLLVIGENSTYFSVYMADGTIGWISKLSVQLTDQQIYVDRPANIQNPSANSALAQSIIAKAQTYLDIPYKYGGSADLSTLDCSLFVQIVFAAYDFRLPRTAAQQFNVGVKVAFEDLQMGDRLYFYNPNTKVIGHTGIYMSDGRFIHASSNRKKVAVDLLSSGNYLKNYAGAMRF